MEVDLTSAMPLSFDEPEPGYLTFRLAVFDQAEMIAVRTAASSRLTPFAGEAIRRLTRARSRTDASLARLVLIMA